MFASFLPFCFSLLLVSITFTKSVHLWVHARGLSPLSFACFLPSLLVQDIFVICVARLLLQRRKGIFSAVGCTFACIFSLILSGAASSQLGFFYETGNEVEWSDAASYVGHSDGLKILLSGLSNVIAAAALIIVTAWVIKWYAYRAAGAFLQWVLAPFVDAFAMLRSRVGSDYNPIDSDDEYDEIDEEKASSRQPRRSSLKTNITSIAAMLVVCVSTFFRPRTPYNLMAATLPFTMLDILQSAPDACAQQAALRANQWPFPELIDITTWETPKDSSKGWAPGSNNQYVQKYRDNKPEWLSSPMPGFSKWTTTEKVESENCSISDDTFYNPVNDPLKISNLDNDIIDVLQQAFTNEDIKIKHVALIMMESYREELFPIQQDSEYHKIILNSHKHPDEDVINERLSQMSPVAEKITGKKGNFKRKDGSLFESAPTPQWNDTAAEGYGGINVVGGFTTSSLSFKSMAAIHCGAWPMPVDNFEEADAESYQACIPQIMNLLNQNKDNTSSDFVDQQWLPAFFQSITDGYDRQDKFDDHIGFKHIVTKNKLDHDAHEQGKELEEINYFGYAETTLREHVQDYIKKVQDEGKRMFFSHFTSTTHHPWGTPDAYKHVDYMDPHGHDEFNNYLNAIRFTDAWLGELMQIFNDAGIANETLIIFVGDHGQAFGEDSSKTGTYENGHVSNFRVPITFRHPQMPRVQYETNATSISILPTLLDLLVNTGSLNDQDTTTISDLVQDYEGQSLIRPYKPTHNGRRAWNFGVINGGGRMLALTSPDAPWRLVMPFDEKSAYRFTDLSTDPLELKPVEDWTKDGLAETVKHKYGEEAAKWVVEAEGVGKWWGLERKRLWGYTGKTES